MSRSVEHAEDGTKIYTGRGYDEYFTNNVKELIERRNRAQKILIEKTLEKTQCKYVKVLPGI